MTWKNTALIGGTVVVIAVGVNQLLEPKTLQEMDRQRQQQQVDQASDADEQSKERMRAASEDGLRSEQGRRLVPGEHRPGLPGPRHRHRIRLRLP